MPTALMHDVVPRAVMAALMAAASSCSANFTILRVCVLIAFNAFNQTNGLEFQEFQEFRSFRSSDDSFVVRREHDAELLSELLYS